MMNPSIRFPISDFAYFKALEVRGFERPMIHETVIECACSLFLKSRCQALNLELGLGSLTPPDCASEHSIGGRPGDDEDSWRSRSYNVEEHAAYGPLGLSSNSLRLAHQTPSSIRDVRVTRLTKTKTC